MCLSQPCPSCQRTLMPGQGEEGKIMQLIKHIKLFNQQARVVVPCRTAIPTYDFNPMNEKLFLNDCKSRVLQPAVQTKLRDLDASFDKATALIGAFYLCCLALWFSGSMAFYFSIPTFALLKTCFASSGHYFLHRTQFSLLLKKLLLP